LLNDGIPEHIVRKMGNWKDRRMLDRYAHLADEPHREAEAQLAARLTGDQDTPSSDQVKEATPRYEARTAS
jgi:hypothetical protein